MNWYNTGVTVTLQEVVASGVKVWDFEYPSYYTGAEKAAFEQKVIDHYLFRQIGSETVGMWLHQFRTTVREIMPYYIQRYKSVALLMNAGDPLESYNLKETYTEDNTGTGKVTSTSAASENKNRGVKGDSTRKFSNTPQGSISNLEKYMTEATQDNTTGSENESATSTGSSGQTSENAGKRTYTMERRGNIGVQPLGQEINVYRSALINVDMEVINELGKLFLLVY